MVFFLGVSHFWFSSAGWCLYNILKCIRAKNGIVCCIRLFFFWWGSLLIPLSLLLFQVEVLWRYKLPLIKSQEINVLRHLFILFFFFLFGFYSTVLPILVLFASMFRIQRFLLVLVSICNYAFALSMNSGFTVTMQPHKTHSQ